MVLSAGDVVDVKENPKSREAAIRGLELSQSREKPSWLAIDEKAFKGEVLHVPTREEIAPVVDEQLIVELYSK